MKLKNMKLYIYLMNFHVKKKSFERKGFVGQTS